MTTTTTHPIATADHDDEPLSDADRAAITRALAEPGIALSADALTELLATGHITDRIISASCAASEQATPVHLRGWPADPAA